MKKGFNPTFKIKFVLAISLSISYDCFFAQTLTLSNAAPVAGDALLYQNANYKPAGPSGINQFWDFSGIIPHGIDIPLNYYKPNTFSSPQQSLSNIAYNKGSVVLYFITDNAGFYEMGNNVASCLIQMNSAFTNLKLRFPFSYGDTASNNNSLWWYDKDVSYTSRTSFTADATGTLVTPCGTYSNTLRLFRRNYVEWAPKGQPNHIHHASTESYEWYSPGVHGHILSVSTSTTVDYLNGPLPPVYKNWIEIYSDKDKTTLSINENQPLEGPYIFNNPASGYLFVKSAELLTNGQTSLSLINPEGKTVLTNMFTCTTLLNVSILGNGVYLLQIRDDAGYFFQRKVIISN